MSQQSRIEESQIFTPIVRGYLLGAGLYYTLISVAHPFYETGRNLVILESLALVAGAIGYGAWWRLRKHAPSLGGLELTTLLINSLFMINVLGYLSLHFEPLKLVYFVLMALAFGTSAPTRRVAYVSVFGALAGLVLMARAAPGDLISQYAFVAVAAGFCALGMSALMRGAVMRAMHARLLSEASNVLLRDKLEENERLRTEAQALARKAESANRAKSEFLATISHEIRTPLNGVLGMAQAMTHDDLSHVQRERLEVIGSSARNLMLVVNDVLDISKIEAGQLELSPQAFELEALMEAMGRLYSPLAEARGVALRLSVHPDAGGWRFGDEVRLRQVLGNLISNAIKFTDEGSVEVGVILNETRVLFTVNDTGSGIPVSAQAHIFDRFVQADGSNTRRSGGTGLGLAICHELAELMGGAIGFDSTPGVGSRFWFEAPLNPVAAPAAVETEASQARDNLRVLVADDNPTNRAVLTTLLAHFDIETGLACDGAEAVAAWEAGPWDAILMDIHMPGLDGLDATRRIRALEAATGRARVPILAVTASVLSHEMQAYYTAGVDGVVPKPIELTQLMQVLDSALAGATGAMEIAAAVA